MSLQKLKDKNSSKSLELKELEDENKKLREYNKDYMFILANIASIEHNKDEDSKLIPEFDIKNVKDRIEWSFSWRLIGNTPLARYILIDPMLTPPSDSIVNVYGTIHENKHILTGFYSNMSNSLFYTHIATEKERALIKGIGHHTLCYIYTKLKKLYPDITKVIVHPGGLIYGKSMEFLVDYYRSLGFKGSSNDYYLDSNIDTILSVCDKKFSGNYSRFNNI